MATVSMLDALNGVIATAQETISHAGRAASGFERARGDFRDLVFLPITSQGIWDGAGLPEASTVVRVHERAQETAALRLRQVESAVGTFEIALRYVRTRYQAFRDHLPDDSTLYDDGRVTTTYTGPAVGAGNPDNQLSADLAEILGLLDAADQAFVQRLGSITADPLPVLTVAATPGVMDAADAAYLAATRDGTPPRWDEDWTLKGNTRAGDRGDWIQALAYGPANSLLPYKGGGFVTGPDGRTYPIATPDFVADGKHYGHGEGVSDLGGEDEGWQTIDSEVGFGLLGQPTSGVAKGVIALGVLAGGTVPSSGVDKEATAGLAIGPDGRAYRTTTGDPDYQKAPDDPFGQRNPETIDTVGGTLDTVTKGLEALNTVQNVDDDQFYTYRAEFQQNVDGRTRVVLTAYQATDDGGVNAYDVHVDADGKLVMERAEWYDDPVTESGPTATGAQGVGE